MTLQKLLGEAYLVSRGYTSKELQVAFEKAYALTSQVNESYESFQVVVGLWMHYVIRGEYNQALHLSQQLVSIATKINENQELLQSEYCTGFTLYYMGRIDNAIEHLDQAVSYIEPDTNYTRQNPSHDDTRIMLYSFVGLANWARGEFDLAREFLDKAHELAPELKHPYGMVRDLYYQAILNLMNEEYEEAARNAAEFMDISKKHNFSFFVLMGMFISAFGIADEKARLGTALKLMETIIPTGARSGITFLFALIIEECIRQQDREQAEKYIRLAEEYATEKLEQVYVSEILRLKALLLMLDEPYDESEAQKLLQEGIDRALKINNKPFALRCAISMAGIKKAEDSALSQLKEILDSCSETPDTKDFARAKQLVQKIDMASKHSKSLVT
jgi:tetratricopeptide (TPR) repeat protein